MKKLFKILFISILAFFVLPLSAEENYVVDETNSLTSEQIQELNDLANEYSAEHNISIYVRIVDSISTDIKSAAKEIKESEHLGDATNGNLVMMVLALESRDYIYICYGDIGNAAFTDYGKEMMDDYVLPPLKEDMFYNASKQFINQCDRYLEEYEAGRPIDNPNGNSSNNGKSNSRTGRKLFTFGFPPLVSLIYCLGLKSRNNNVQKANQAASYIRQNSLNLDVQEDIYLRTDTHTVSRHESSSSSGTTVDSDGSSSHSGKF